MIETRRKTLVTLERGPEISGRLVLVLIRALDFVKKFVDELGAAV